MMAAIRGRDTGPEMVLRRYLHAAGLRYRLHDSKLPGRPDVVLSRDRIAVFVHGCFWHRHPGCRFAAMPRTRQAFWSDKFAANVARDQRVEDRLRSMGWQPLVIWECEVRDEFLLDELVWRILSLRTTHEIRT